jgi:hypothetical protein
MPHDIPQTSQQEPEVPSTEEEKGYKMQTVIKHCHNCKEETRHMIVIVGEIKLFICQVHSEFIVRQATQMLLFPAIDHRMFKGGDS